MSPWRKLGTGEIIYFPWFSKSKAYLEDFNVARRVQIFEELLMTIGSPIVIYTTIIQNLDKSNFARLQIVVGVMLLVFIVDFIYKNFIIRKLSKFDISKLASDDQIAKVFPQTNLSKPISSIYRTLIGSGLLFFVFVPISPALRIISLILFIALVVYNIREALKIRVTDWSSYRVLR